MNKIDLIDLINKNNISLGIPNDKTELRFIDDKVGYGRFAKEDIAKDSIVYRIGGMWLTYEERKNFKQDYFHLVEGHYFFQGGLIPHLNGTHNHSCDPSCYVEDNTIRALVDVKKDQQLTVDYSSFINHTYTIIENCLCGSINCRKKITGQDWILYDLPEKYNYKVSGEILRHYLSNQTRSYS